MKRIGCLLLCAFGVLAGLGSMEISYGFAATMDSALISFGVSPVSGLSFTAAIGPAWERRADLRMDDVEVRCSARYSPWPDGKFVPYAVAGYGLFLVDTSYSRTAAHGILLGAGLEFRCRPKAGIHLQGGWRYGRGTVLDEYHGPAASVYSDETWKAPWLWVDLGLRLYPENR